MKNRTNHIFSAVFLIGSLLFAQVAVNFFHRNHDVHQLKSVTSPLKDGAAELQKHGDHCKVCSVDVFNHAFVNSIDQYEAFPVTEKYLAAAIFKIEWITVSYAKDRAPPVYYF